MWSIDFYRSQRERYGTDSGFRELGYLIIATDEAQGGGGARARWRARGRAHRRPQVDAAEAARLNPTLDVHVPRRDLRTRRRVRRPAAERARLLLVQRAGVELRERTAFLGLERSSAGDVIGVETSDGAIATDRVSSPAARRSARSGRSSGPVLRGRRPSPGRGHRAPRGVRRRAPADGLRERRRAVLAPRGGRTAVRDVEPRRGAGAGARGRLAVPSRDGGPRASLRADREGPRDRKAWAATIEYCPTTSGGRAGPDARRRGAPGGDRGHRRRARDDVGTGRREDGADLALEGATDVTDATGWGMDRFDEHGRSPSYDDRAPVPRGADDDPPA